MLWNRNALSTRLGLCYVHPKKLAGQYLRQATACGLLHSSGDSERKLDIEATQSSQIKPSTTDASEWFLPKAYVLGLSYISHCTGETEGHMYDRSFNSVSTRATNIPYIKCNCTGLSWGLRWLISHGCTGTDYEHRSVGLQVIAFVTRVWRKLFAQDGQSPRLKCEVTMSCSVSSRCAAIVNQSSEAHRSFVRSG